MSEYTTRRGYLRAMATKCFAGISAFDAVKEGSMPDQTNQSSVTTVTVKMTFRLGTTSLVPTSEEKKSSHMRLGGTIGLARIDIQCPAGTSIEDLLDEAEDTIDTAIAEFRTLEKLEGPRRSVQLQRIEAEDFSPSFDRDNRSASLFIPFVMHFKQVRTPQQQT